MASAPNIVRKLIEGIDDPEDLDSPESFDVAGHLDSPVARLAATNGFTQLDRHEGEERWVKKLRNGQEAWLRTTSRSPYDSERPMDMRDPQRSGGREWEFLVVKPQFKCDYCNQDRPAKKGVCPHCKKTDKIVRWNSHEQIARGNEVVMSYLLGAILQRLATWPEHLPKPGQPGWKKAFENLGVDDPDDPSAMLPHLKAQEGCPHCGCPEFDRGTSFVSPLGHAVHNQICRKCGRYYCRGEEKTRIVPEALDVDDPEAFVKNYANRKWEPRPIPPPHECPKFALFARLETTNDSATKDMLKAGKRLNDLPRYKDVVLYSDRRAKNFVARIPWHHSGKPVSRSKWVTINNCRRPLFWIPV